MSQITTKPRIRLTAEAMPQHCLVPPEGAPDCYGDSEASEQGMEERGLGMRQCGVNVGFEFRRSYIPGQEGETGSFCSYESY